MVSPARHPLASAAVRDPARRRLLQAGAVGAVAALLGTGSRAGPATPVRRETHSARNVILCIADGVGSGHYALARAAAGRPLCFEPWVCGLLATASADAAITDSAAAGTALATGHRTRNGSVGVDTSGRPCRSVLEAARAAGLGTGLVVTGGFTTATAAVFAAHEARRSATVEIARQMVAADLTVMLGGGRGLLRETMTPGGDETLADRLRARGYAMPSTAADLARTAPGKVFGLFGDGALQPVIDRSALAPAEPSLPEMTRHALDTLAQAADGFFLLVEGTQADWAGHQNDPGMLLHELLEFDAAVGEVQRFAEGRDDTLVIVLSDHGCGGAVVGNARSQRRKSDPFRDDAVLAPLRQMRCSSQALWEAHGIGKAPDVTTVRRIVAEHWGVDFTTAQAEEVLAIARRPERDEDFDGLGAVFSRDFTYLGWTTHEHTAEDVPLYARGPGAPSGAMHLTGIAHTMAQALGLELT